jgi:hypothetical protein
MTEERQQDRKASSCAENLNQDMQHTKEYCDIRLERELSQEEHKPKVTIEWLTLLLRIREVPYSNLCLKTRF